MKKLLGLLAITPMAVTACGSADPVVEKEVETNIMVYSHDALSFAVSSIVLESEDDYEGYDKLGRDIKEYWNENNIIEEATKVVLQGTIGGVEFNKEVKVDGIYNDADEMTPFSNFKGALTHYYKQTDNMSTYANFAFHLKDSGEHFTPTEILQSEEDDLETCFKNEFDFSGVNWYNLPEAILDANIDQDGALDLIQEDNQGSKSVQFYLLTDAEFLKHGIDDSYTTIVRDCVENTLFDFTGWTLYLEWDLIKMNGTATMLPVVKHESQPYAYSGIKKFAAFLHNYK